MSLDASFNPTNDMTFDAEHLRAKYDGLAEDSKWGEHPDHRMDVWEADVHCRNTRVGYWDWVVVKLKLTDDESDENLVLAEAEEEEIVELRAEDPGNQGA
jgi:hypothetical protein